MEMMYRSIIVVLLLHFGSLGMTGCRTAAKPADTSAAPAAPTAAAARPQPAGWIAFIRDDNVWMMRPDGREARALTHEGGCASPAVSPDGQKVAFVGRKGEESDVYLVDLQGGTPKRLSQDLDVYHPAWSPQGQHLSYLRLPAADEQGGEQSEGLVDLLRPVVLRNLTEALRFDEFEGSGAPQFINEETVFLVQTDENETIQALWRLNLDSTTGEQIALPRVDFDPYFCHPAISPDGQNLAYVSLSDKGEGHLVQTLTGDILARWGPHEPLGSDVPFPPPVWSPDGRWVLFEHTDLSEGDQAGLWVTEVETGQSWRLYATTADAEAERRVSLTGYSWSPDGQRLALGIIEASGFGEEEKTTLFVAAVDAATGKVTRLAENAAEPSWGGGT
jgi:Tol biopolymer transport system component